MPIFRCFFLSIGRSSALTLDALKTDEDPKEIDFFTKQARLQIEARMALAQAKDIAHMQMEVMKQFIIFTLLKSSSHQFCVCLFFVVDGTSKANGIANH